MVIFRFYVLRTLLDGSYILVTIMRLQERYENNMSNNNYKQKNVFNFPSIFFTLCFNNN